MKILNNLNVAFSLGKKIIFVAKIRSNNKLMVGGTFYRYHIFPRNGLAQINL